MPTAEMEAWEVACAEATQADGTIDEARRGEVYKAEYERRVAQRQKKLMSDTRATWRAMDGWARINSEDDWREVVRKTADELESSQFFLDRLGADRRRSETMTAASPRLRCRLSRAIDRRTASGAMIGAH